MYQIIFFLSVPIISLLVEGIRRKLIARFQNRIGPPIVQPFYDLAKLWHKERSTSFSYSNILFILLPILYFVSTYALFLFVPFPLINFDYDFLFVVYLTILSSVLYILAGAIGGQYGIVGSGREMAARIAYKVCLAAVVFTFFLHAGVLSFGDFTSQFLMFSLPIASLCLLCVCIIETKTTPFDTVEAAAEIYAGPTTEFSGRELAFFHFASWMKMLFFPLFAAMLLVGNVNLPFFALASVLLIFFFAFLRAVTGRYRLDQTLWFFIGVLLLSLINFAAVT